MSDAYNIDHFPWRSKFTDDNIAEFKEAFMEFDQDGGGTIDLDELGSLLRNLGQNPSEEELEEIVAEADEDGNGEIDFAEFLGMMARKITEVEENEEKILEAFKVLDKDCDNFISPDELRQVMAMLGEKMTDEEAAEMIKVGDKDGDGLLSYEEFLLLIRSG
ncbi:neo-calmodulin-like [Symsagittifera roscoffensis]|uniref:neo-calmodulin-like n=1 Tax=Symsagittifera roscoffensis TaxID=84072 RepID=UPI00307B6544